MIILPDKNTPRSKFLMPMARKEWMTPSQAQPKDMFGGENRTSFCIRGHLNDGYVKWRGRFDDRDDADAFLWAIATDTLQYERELWRLPNPWWHPDLGEMLYAATAYNILTSPTGSNQTWTRPADFSANNTIDTIGGGGSGGADTDYHLASGGGGGAWNRVSNWTSTSTASYQIGTGGTAVSYSGTTSANGNNGSDTWFNGTAVAGSTVGSKAGARGDTAVSTLPAALGGSGAGGVGTLSNDGGSSGNTSGTHTISTGGGGAAGPHGAGGNGVNLSGADGGTAGGNGDASTGGVGGAGSQAGNASAGGNGTEMGDGSVGAGGGGGGCHLTTATAVGGDGGRYGAGSGAGSGSSTGISGTGGSGLIIIAYTPFVAPPSARFFANPGFFTS